MTVRGGGGATYLPQQVVSSFIRFLKDSVKIETQCPLAIRLQHTCPTSFACTSRFHPSRSQRTLLGTQPLISRRVHAHRVSTMPPATRRKRATSAHTFSNAGQKMAWAPGRIMIPAHIIYTLFLRETTLSTCSLSSSLTLRLPSRRETGGWYFQIAGRNTARPRGG